MRLRTGVTLLAALAPLAFASPSAGAVERPAYINVIVESDPRVDSQPGRGQPPRFRVETIDANGGVIDTSFGISPHVKCTSVFEQFVQFTVTCAPVSDDPIMLGDETVISGWRCENAAVRAEIQGPRPNEWVTGTITCGEPPATTGASCTATASTPDVLAGGFSGMCFQPAPNGPLPITCTVDLSGVWLDTWRVTCYGTDP